VCGVVRQVELAIKEIHIMSRADQPPFDVESAARSAETIEEVRAEPCLQHPLCMPTLKAVRVPTDLVQ